MLSSLKILDFTSLLPGPFATMQLADLGADVIRIQNPNVEDPVKKLPPKTEDGVSAVYKYLNRNKRILPLNLKTEEGRELIFKLVSKYDIIIEGFSPGTMEKLGLGYDDLKKHNPELIYLSLTGYGQSGPLKDRPGHDINYLALSGLGSLISDSSSPVLPGTQIADIGGSMYTVISVLSAVIGRTGSGTGQYIDVAMRDTTMSLFPVQLPRYLMGQNIPSDKDHILSGKGHYDYYETKDNEYLSIGSLEPKFLQRLLNILNISQTVLSKDLSMIKNAIRDTISRRSLSDWIEIFEGSNACVEPVLDISQAVEHEQNKARENIVKIRNNGHQQIQMALPVKFSDYLPTYELKMSEKHVREIFDDIQLPGSYYDDLVSQNIIDLSKM